MRRRKKRWRLSLETRRSIQRTKWALGIPYSPQTESGLRAEVEVFEAIRYHKAKKTRFPGDRRIIKVEEEPHFSQADEEEKDGFVTFLSKAYGIEIVEIVPVQVKVKGWWSLKVERRLREKRICLIAIWLYNREGKRKPPDQVRKEAREKSFAVLSNWFLWIDEQKVKAIS